jgi:predicted RNA-binding Zn-ribbon protein involved in translation (DUF1610 family)
MEHQLLDNRRKKPKISAHMCPQCGFSVNLKDIGLMGGATGLVTCPNCDWSGPVEIRIVDKEPTD